VSFEEGIERTVRWYLENRPWWQELVEGRYATQRLGLATG
jgi:dTDP-glucose 4,6-dehydratase